MCVLHNRSRMDLSRSRNLRILHANLTVRMGLKIYIGMCLGRRSSMVRTRLMQIDVSSLCGDGGRPTMHINVVRYVDPVVFLFGISSFNYFEADIT